MNRRAFTLIELLIVVAIIAILAAIAVPNLLEAQMRARVTRTKADMRTVGICLESYHVDYNNYMPAYPKGFNMSITDPKHPWYGWAQNFLMLETPTGHLQGGDLGNLLTTPISYMTTIPVDPFWTAYLRALIPTIDIKKACFLYASDLIKPVDFTLRGDAPWTADNIHPTYRSIRWWLRSVGPCRRFTDFAIYDPTNGTTSFGELMWLNTVGPLWK